LLPTVTQQLAVQSKSRPFGHSHPGPA